MKKTAKIVTNALVMIGLTAVVLWSVLHTGHTDSTATKEQLLNMERSYEQMGLSLALNGKPKEALFYLRHAAIMGLSPALTGNPSVPRFCFTTSLTDSVESQAQDECARTEELCLAIHTLVRVTADQDPRVIVSSCVLRHTS